MKGGASAPSLQGEELGEEGGRAESQPQALADGLRAAPTSPAWRGGVGRAVLCTVHLGPSLEPSARGADAALVWEWQTDGQGRRSPP